MQMRFTVDCRDCSRLAGFLDEVKACYPDYYARPVPAFGDVAPELLIIGLVGAVAGSAFAILEGLMSNFGFLRQGLVAGEANFTALAPHFL